MTNHLTPTHSPLILLTGGTGTTGRRIADRLRARHVAVRIASRSGTPPFDWDQPDTWPALLDGVTAAYIAYSPDIAMPGAADIVDRFCRAAVDAGVQHLVLLAGRGEPEAEAAEQVVRDSGARWTIVRASWFAQNFSEGMLLDATRSGTIIMPARDVGEPFVDVEDIADVAATALVEPGHDGRIYDVTGPRLLTFTDAAAELAAAAGRSDHLRRGVAGRVRRRGGRRGSADRDWPTGSRHCARSCSTGATSTSATACRKRLGRAPRDFRDFAIRAAAEGAWTTADATRCAMSWRPVAIGAAAVGSGLVGGVLFAFSSFVMPALRRIPPAAGHLGDAVDQPPGTDVRVHVARRRDRGRVGRRRGPRRAEP